MSQPNAASTENFDESHIMAVCLIVFEFVGIGIGLLLGVLWSTDSAIWFLWVYKWAMYLAVLGFVGSFIEEAGKRRKQNESRGYSPWDGFFTGNQAFAAICVVAAVWLPISAESWMKPRPPLVVANLPHPITASSHPANATTSSQPQSKIAEVRQKIAKLNSGRVTSQLLLDKTIQEKDAVAQRLREMGVKSSADLQRIKGAKTYAESLQRMVGEIERYERDLARFDKAISEANGLIRRLERAETLTGVGLDEEIAALSEQTMNLDEAVDGVSSTARPDPIQSADVLDQELQRSSKEPPKRTAASSLADQLVGKWRVIEGHRSGHVEFTKGGTALLLWDDGFANGLGERGRRATLKYSLKGNNLHMHEPRVEYGQKLDVEIEVRDQDELVLVNQRNSMSFDWLDGRIKRVIDEDAAETGRQAIPMSDSFARSRRKK